MSFRGCKWCQATRRNGCLMCDSEADKAYKEQFPDGPKPIATFRTDTPEAAERVNALLKKVFTGAEAVANERAGKLLSSGDGIRALTVAVIDGGMTEAQVRSRVAGSLIGEIVAEQLAAAACPQCRGVMEEKESLNSECSRFVCPDCGYATPMEELPQ